MSCIHSELLKGFSRPAWPRLHRGSYPCWVIRSPDGCGVRVRAHRFATVIHETADNVPRDRLPSTGGTLTAMVAPFVARAGASATRGTLSAPRPATGDRRPATGARARA